MKPFWVYILRCSDSSYDVGHTDDLERRMAEHQAGSGGYTASRLPIELAWSQPFSSRDEALQAERQLKGWSRKKKEAMIRGDWLEVQRLAWGKKNPLPDHLGDPLKPFEVGRQESASIPLRTSGEPQHERKQEAPLGTEV